MLMISGGVSVKALSITQHKNPIIDQSSIDPPSSFDLRNVNGNNYVTSVKDQTPWGTCWAHAIMAGMESNLLITENWKNAGEEGEPDLSESHIDWWNGFNDFNNDDAPGSDGLTVHWGAEIRVASAYFARGEGPVREIDAPYHESDTPPDRTKSSYHYFYINDIDCYDIKTNLSNMDLIKNQIMTYGAMNIGMCYANQFMNFQKYTHYQPPTSSDAINHNVAVIGWNDTIVTQAPQPGAWLCKNSWSPYWGLDGYFWISYYDKYCCQYDFREWTATFHNVEPMPYNQFFYHDYHGWQDTMQDCTEIFNAFHTTSNTVLHAVNFFTAADNVDYTIRIYNTFEDNTLQDELSTKSGIIPHMGFHTIHLNEPVNLVSDDNFYIYLYLSDGGQPYDRTIEAFEWWAYKKIESIAHPGESYFYENGTWHDLYEYDDSANFCIKGLAVGPQFTIDIKPGMGLGITVDFKNQGIGNAYDVPWEINVQGGILGGINKTLTGNADISEGETNSVKTGMMFGLGPIVITAKIADKIQHSEGTQIIILTINK